MNALRLPPAGDDSPRPEAGVLPCPDWETSARADISCAGILQAEAPDVADRRLRPVSGCSLPPFEPRKDRAAAFAPPRVDAEAWPVWPVDPAAPSS